MTRVLLTGGSGFIAAHVLHFLLEKGYSVVTTVRNAAKADGIKKAYPQHEKETLDFVIVSDIAVKGAFDEAVKSDPPFDAVIHTASPFTFAITNVQTQLLDPAVIGTSGLLESIKTYAPSVTRVVITSSFAAIRDGSKGNWPDHTYSEADWNPVTLEEALLNPSNGYSASKTFAERAAWEFVEREKPGFAITTINPPLVFGPVTQALESLDDVNTSNARTRDALLGKWKEEIPDSRVFIWIDVRDVALTHVLALEGVETANKRVFVTAGHYSNKEIVNVIRKNFPEYEDRLPGREYTDGGIPDAYFKIDNSRAKKLLNQDFISFEQSIVDLVKSLKTLGA